MTKTIQEIVDDAINNTFESVLTDKIERLIAEQLLEFSAKHTKKELAAKLASVLERQYRWSLRAIKDLNNGPC